MAATLASIAPQLGAGDEVIVVADPLGHVNRAEQLLDESGVPSYAFITCDTPNTGPGYAQRAIGMQAATGTHLLFIDDDDIYLPGAFELMRDASSKTLHAPTIFRMIHPLLGVLWHTPELMYGNVGSPMFLVPNDPGRLGTWEPLVGGRGGDFVFIRGCVERMGEPLWREEIVADVSPAGAQVGSHVMGALA